MKSFVRYISEELPTKEIKPSEFPNPLKGKLKAIFQHKGDMDGNKGDDVVPTKSKSWKANALKPSQSAIYLGKSLSMAIGGVKGGDLGSIVSEDKRILDGHHRWAATLLAEPTATIKGLEARLGIGDLVPVLRGLGDSIGNTRRGEPKGGDVNIYKASIKDAMDMITTGKNMNPKFYNKKKSIAWLESIGGKSELLKRLKFVQRNKPPKGAPPRIDMPVIDADKGDERKASKLLNKGHIDVRKPYAKVEESMSKKLGRMLNPKYAKEMKRNKEVRKSIKRKHDLIDQEKWSEEELDSMHPDIKPKTWKQRKKDMFPDWTTTSNAAT